MPLKTIGFKLLFEDSKLPTRAYAYDAGIDLYSREEKMVLPNDGCKFSTGVAIDIPEGYYGQIHTRSSMAAKGWVVVGGVIDCSYKGELFVVLRNVSDYPLNVKSGDRIAQVVIHKIETPAVVCIDDIGSSERNTGGFGSTGR